MEEAEVIREIKAEITRSLHIDLAKTPIHLKKEDGVIIIEGEVLRVAHKKKAILIAIKLAGIGGVVDRVTVKPAKEMGDKEIRKHIYDAYDGEPTINASKIDIQVDHGIVDIEGKIPSLCHKRLAGLLAWWVPGSRDVINSLEVDPPEEDSDDEITEAVVFALGKDRLVDHSNILVTTKDWVVTLNGNVRSKIERDAAEDDAWYIWGVNDVVNKVKVRV